MSQIYYQTYFNAKKITIYKFYDAEFKSDRYSYSIDENHHCGGYGENNEIIYPNDKIALLNAISHIADKKDFLRIKREFLIDVILNEK